MSWPINVVAVAVAAWPDFLELLRCRLAHVHCSVRLLFVAVIALLSAWLKEIVLLVEDGAEVADEYCVMAAASCLKMALWALVLIAMSDSTVSSDQLILLLKIMTEVGD